MFIEAVMTVLTLSGPLVKTPPVFFFIDGEGDGFAYGETLVLTELRQEPSFEYTGDDGWACVARFERTVLQKELPLDSYGYPYVAVGGDNRLIPIDSIIEEIEPRTCTFATQK